MTRQNFVAIAKILNDAKVDKHTIDWTAERLANYFASVNPNFDHGKFMDAVEKGY